ncbi:MAG: AMP-binding protein [Agathobacter sp.]
MNEEIFQSKYHRSEPIRKFNVDDTLYNTVMNTNEKTMNLKYSKYFIFEKNFYSLKEETDKLATALKRDGVKEDDKVGVMLLTVPQVDPTLLGVNKIGAISYWMDASLKSNDILHYIIDNNIEEIIVSDPFKPIFEKIIDKTNLRRVIFVPVNPFDIRKTKSNDERFIDYRDFINVKADKSIKCVKYDRERPSVIVQSSGSTGKSKSIVHTDYNFNNAILKMAYSDLPFYIGKRGFVCAPPWVIYGLVNSIYSGLVLGNQTIFSVKPDEDMIFKHIGEFDYVYGVPVYLRYVYNKMKELLDNNNIKEYEKIRKQLDKVEMFISGGDKILEEELIKWELMFNTPIINGYGNNELVGAAVVSPLFANKPGSIGIPMHGNIAKTFDSETNEMLESGEIGELAISTDSMFLGYLNNKEETELIKKFHHGKWWVHTGDLASIDQDNYIFLKGRSKRLIIDKLGYKISPDNAEKLISTNPFVEECVVVGVEIEENNTVPMAFIELKNEYKGNESIIADIDKWCRENMKEYERPKIFTEIDKIPHKENGGKQNFLLLEQLAKEHISSKNKTSIKV